MSSAVTHVESGSCCGCRGHDQDLPDDQDHDQDLPDDQDHYQDLPDDQEDNARQAIYGLARNVASNAISGTPKIEIQTQRYKHRDTNTEIQTQRYKHTLEYSGGYATSTVPDNPIANSH